MDSNSELDKVLEKYFVTFGAIPLTYVWGFLFGPDCVILSSFVFTTMQLPAKQKHSSRNEIW